MGFTAENKINLDPYYQAASNRQPKTDNPLLSNSFKFNIERVPHVSYFCQRANIPALGFNFTEVPSRFGAKINIGGTSFDFDDLTISFIVDEKLENWLEIYNWMRSISNLETEKRYVDFEQHTSDAEIITLTSAYKAHLVFKLKNVFPVSLGAINFDSTVSDTEPVIVDVTFKYTTYTVHTLNTPTV